MSIPNYSAQRKAIHFHALNFLDIIVAITHPTLAGSTAKEAVKARHRGARGLTLIQKEPANRRRARAAVRILTEETFDIRDMLEKGQVPNNQFKVVNLDRPVLLGKFWGQFSNPVKFRREPPASITL